MSYVEKYLENQIVLAPVVLRPAVAALNQGRLEAAFIDTSVMGWEVLAAGVPEGIEVVLLDGQKDGVLQMAEWAKSHTGYNAIHILSHGSAGNIRLGTADLNNSAFNQYQNELSEIGNSLTADGDILVYGCHVANGEVGQEFIGKLAQATGADIAASDDVTGSADKGGDWMLERHTSNIETITLELQNYSYVLDLSSAQVRIRADDGLGDYSYTSYVNVGVSTEFGTDALNPLSFLGFTADIDPTNSRITNS